MTESQLADTVRMSVSLPRLVTFRQWVTTFTDDTETVSVDQAEQFVRIVCRIQSRSELASDVEAAKLFHSLLRANYVAWRDDSRRRAKQ